jgi:Myb-like DNA-binding domain
MDGDTEWVKIGDIIQNSNPTVPPPPHHFSATDGGTASPMVESPLGTNRRGNSNSFAATATAATASSSSSTGNDHLRESPPPAAAAAPPPPPVPYDPISPIVSSNDSPDVSSAENGPHPQQSTGRHTQRANHNHHNNTNHHHHDDEEEEADIVPQQQPPITSTTCGSHYYGGAGSISAYPPPYSLPSHNNNNHHHHHHHHPTIGNHGPPPVHYNMYGHPHPSNSSAAAAAYGHLYPPPPGGPYGPPPPPLLPPPPMSYHPYLYDGTNSMSLPVADKTTSGGGGGNSSSDGEPVAGYDYSGNLHHSQDGTLMDGGCGMNGSRGRKSGPKPWTKEEDALLLNLVHTMQWPMKWTVVAGSLPDRTGKQCRERYVNHLNPRLKNSDWTPVEDATIFHLYNTIGSHWAKMSKIIPGRTDNGIKNRFHNIRRQYEREDTHRLRLSNVDDYKEEIRHDRLRNFPDHLTGKALKLWDMKCAIGVLAAQSIVNGSSSCNSAFGSTLNRSINSNSHSNRFGPFREVPLSDDPLTNAVVMCMRCGFIVPSVHTGNDICTKTGWCISCVMIPPNLCGNLLREALNLRRCVDMSKSHHPHTTELRQVMDTFAELFHPTTAADAWPYSRTTNSSKNKDPLVATTTTAVDTATTDTTNATTIATTTAESIDDDDVVPAKVEAE